MTHLVKVRPVLVVSPESHVERPTLLRSKLMMDPVTIIQERLYRKPRKPRKHARLTIRWTPREQRHLGLGGVKGKARKLRAAFGFSSLKGEKVAQPTKANQSIPDKNSGGCSGTEYKPPSEL